MQLDAITTNPRADHLNRATEELVNRFVRGWDDAMARVRLGGRKAPYDDGAYEFLGGAQEKLRKKHYDKSLRLLWKAQQHVPWSSFRDMTADENALVEQGLGSLTDEEKAERDRITSAEFRAMLDREYTREQKQAIVTVLSAIGHGEAYAWLVSAELISQVRSTGARAALTMQVVEEAKHFVVLRELLQAFDVEIPRLSGWEYLFLEQVFKADGLEKMYGMNVLVEGIALSLFGMMSTMPGLEVLRLFHLDESRHTGLPMNYFREFPLTKWKQISPAARLSRIRLILPAVPLVFYLEAPMAVLGLDTLEFGGSVVRKLAHLSVRGGFLQQVDADLFVKAFNAVLNGYGRLTRPDHRWTEFTAAETTRGAAELEVEADAFAAA